MSCCRVSQVSSLLLLTALAVTGCVGGSPADLGDDGVTLPQDESESLDGASTDGESGDGPGDGEGGGTSSGDPSESTTQGSETDSSAGSDGAETDTGESDSGGGDICGPSLGAGGVVGLQELIAPSFASNPAVLYVPSGYTAGTPTPLMIALHGSGDTAQNFTNVWQSIAENEGFIVLVPESTTGGASWNAAGDSAVIGEELDVVLSEFNIDECRIYLTGYSAGAHVGYAIGLYNSMTFAGLGMQAGSLNYASQAGIWPGQVPRPIAVDIHHGVNDPVVPIASAEHARDQLEGAGHVVYYSTHAGGHEIPSGNAQSMWDNLAAHRVDE